MRTVGALTLAVALAGCGGVSAPVPVVDPDTGAPRAVIASAQIGALKIPALDVDTQLVRLGLDAEGEHEVPPVNEPEVAGWYTLGVTPGDPGPAVILGHVNGGGRPGVFARLTALEAGSQVVVERDGVPVTFAVYDVVRVDKDAYPAERVYGDVPAPELRLVTCGGVLNRQTGHYEDNLIVFARAVGA